MNLLGKLCKVIAGIVFEVVFLSIIWFTSMAIFYFLFRGCR